MSESQKLSAQAAEHTRRAEQLTTEAEVQIERGRFGRAAELLEDASAELARTRELCDQADAATTAAFSRAS